MDRYAIKLGKEPPLFDVRVVSQTRGKVLSKRKKATLTFVPETEMQKAEINNLSNELWKTNMLEQDVSLLKKAIIPAIRKTRQESFISHVNSRYKLLKSER
jgi:hypothetical protein